jgi:hypothetical protein
MDLDNPSAGSDPQELDLLSQFRERSQQRSHQRQFFRTELSEYKSRLDELEKLLESERREVFHEQRHVSTSNSRSESVERKVSSAVPEPLKLPHRHRDGQSSDSLDLLDPESGEGSASDSLAEFDAIVAPPLPADSSDDSLHLYTSLRPKTEKQVTEVALTEQKYIEYFLREKGKRTLLL